MIKARLSDIETILKESIKAIQERKATSLVFDIPQKMLLTKDSDDACNTLAFEQIEVELYK